MSPVRATVVVVGHRLSPEHYRVRDFLNAPRSPTSGTRRIRPKPSAADTTICVATARLDGLLAAVRSD